MSDDKGKWTFREMNGRGEQVSFIVAVNGVTVIGASEKWDKAVFSGSPATSEGTTVFIHRFQLPEVQRYQGLGPRALQHILNLYREAGCVAVEVAAPTPEGKRCYSKLGFRSINKDSPRMKLSMSPPPVCPQEMLSLLLNKKTQGRPTTTNSRATQKRRVMRMDQPGIAKKVAMLFESIIANVNQVQGLDLHPLTLRDTLYFMQEGTPILEECKTTTQTAILAQSQLDLLTGSGRAHTRSVLGVMAKTNKRGKLTTKEVHAATGLSESWIRRCRLDVEKDGLGSFGATSKSGYRKAQRLCPTRLIPSGECEDQDCRLLHDCQRCKNGSQCSASACKNWDLQKALRADKARVNRIAKLSRKTYDEAELTATQKWMTMENPARSGDQKEICWMVKGRFDFYHENYRFPSLSFTHYVCSLSVTHTLSFFHTHSISLYIFLFHTH